MIVYLWPVLYVAAILAANWALITFGVIPIGFGLMAPAGVVFAGLTFSFRNLTQQTLGRSYGYGAIVVGALLSYFISGAGTIPGGVLPVALASGITFLISETADALVWSRFRQTGQIRAMVAGDIAGQVIDSIVFLLLAIGNLDFLLGQVIGKWYTVLPVVLAMWLWRKRGERERAYCAASA